MIWELPQVARNVVMKIQMSNGVKLLNNAKENHAAQKVQQFANSGRSQPTTPQMLMDAQSTVAQLMNLGAHSTTTVELNAAQALKSSAVIHALTHAVKTHASTLANALLMMNAVKLDHYQVKNQPQVPTTLSQLT